MLNTIEEDALELGEFELLKAVSGTSVLNWLKLISDLPQDLQTILIQNFREHQAQQALLEFVTKATVFMAEQFAITVKVEDDTYGILLVKNMPTLYNLFTKILQEELIKNKKESQSDGNLVEVDFSRGRSVANNPEDY